MTFPDPFSGAVVVSVVSHGHGPTVQPLLYALVAGVQAGTSVVQRVVLTLNLPESAPVPPPEGWPFVLQIIHNARPAGFGANHNRALARAVEPFVCVLNPDVVLADGDPFAALVQAAAAPGIGCAYPVQVDAQGQLQDSERALPTPKALWRRRALGQREVRVDWVNAACLVLPQPVWQALGGFDESYFMYCEDVDLCLRMRLAGLTLVRAPVQIEHGGQRASHRCWAHLRWHLYSLLRLWRSPVYRQARQLLRAEVQHTGTIGAS
ncbi:glycosyltransferase [Simplicispira psychrophila]|uniref:glycosyltransferase n=1 Tax=Simplicispira psychrophila TaxID=80882 RepID=UPI000485C13C|nr:glycosyltransferase [Simplicispira psychrophila]